jgi:hypothetical protein
VALPVREVQRIIEDAVTAAFPQHGFLGEESVPPGAEASAAGLALFTTLCCSHSTVQLMTASKVHVSSM